VKLAYERSKLGIAMETLKRQAIVEFTYVFEPVPQKSFAQAVVWL